MKRKLFKTIALLMALALLAGLALSEGVLEAPDMGLDIEDTEGLELGEGPIADVVEEMPEDIELSLGALDLEAHVTYRFIVDEVEVATQAARAGEEILRPEAPKAPKGKAFAGWALADGTPLFADADGDGKIDPVIVRDDELGTEVCVWAVFSEAATEEAPAEEESTEEEPAQEEEVVPQAGATTGDGTEGETTSSVSPDGEPASPEGEALDAPAGEETAEESAEEEPGEETEEAPTDEHSVPDAPVANALVYTGEAQALVSTGEGWLFSMDGEAYTPDIPTAVDAGEYTVFFKAAEDAEAQAVTVTVAKADVVLIPPEAMSGEA